MEQALLANAIAKEVKADTGPIQKWTMDTRISASTCIHVEVGGIQIMRRQQ
jgi:hypothetical protein